MLWWPCSVRKKVRIKWLVLTCSLVLVIYVHKTSVSEEDGGSLVPALALPQQAASRGLTVTSSPVVESLGEVVAGGGGGNELLTQEEGGRKEKERLRQQLLLNKKTRFRLQAPVSVPLVTGFHSMARDSLAARLQELEATSVAPLVSRAGEMGKPVLLQKEKLSQEVQHLIDKGWQDNAFNQYVSDMISVSRSLPDVRHPE